MTIETVVLKDYRGFETVDFSVAVWVGPLLGCGSVIPLNAVCQAAIVHHFWLKVKEEIAEHGIQSVLELPSRLGYARLCRYFWRY
jgi:hypothetical protein